MGCYALAFDPLFGLFYSCDALGNIGMWDFRQQRRVEKFMCHLGGTTCVDITNNGTQMFTGGMDKFIRCWDLRTNHQLLHHDFSSRIYSLSYHSSDDLLIIGLESGDVLITQGSFSRLHILPSHVDAVTSLKFAPSGKWFVSVGEDSFMNVWRSDNGVAVYRKEDTSSVQSCDISSDEKVIVTGSHLKATLYKITF